MANVEISPWLEDAIERARRGDWSMLELLETEMHELASGQRKRGRSADDTLDLLAPILRRLPIGLGVWAHAWALEEYVPAPNAPSAQQPTAERRV